MIWQVSDDDSVVWDTYRFTFEEPPTPASESTFEQGEIENGEAKMYGEREDLVASHKNLRGYMSQVKLNLLKLPGLK